MTLLRLGWCDTRINLLGPYFDTLLDVKVTVLFNTDKILCEKFIWNVVYTGVLWRYRARRITTFEGRDTVQWKKIVKSIWLSKTFCLYLSIKDCLSIEQLLKPALASSIVSRSEQDHSSTSIRIVLKAKVS